MMTDLEKLVRTLNDLGYSDDSGNSLPTVDDRYCIVEMPAVVGVYTVLRLGEGNAEPGSVCEFVFKDTGKFVEHRIRKF